MLHLQFQKNRFEWNVSEKVKCSTTLRKIKLNMTILQKKKLDAAFQKSETIS